MVPPNQLSILRNAIARVCICISVILTGFNTGYSQVPTANYLTGNKTGNLVPLGILGTGGGTITTPMSSHSYLGFFQFYYGNAVLTSATTTPAIVRASRSVSVANIVLAGSDAYIQFRNASNNSINAGITTYIKLGTAPSLTGLSAPLGGLLGLNNVYDIQGRGYSGATNYNTTLGGAENPGTTAGTTGGTLSQLVVDASGVWHAAIKPDANYNAVRLNVGYAPTVDLISISRDLDVNVYNAFYYSPPSGADCGTPIFTTPGEVTGVSLNLGAVASLLALDTAVKNPELAIDASQTTYSRITSGALGVATSVSQTILFNGTTGLTTDAVKVKLSLPASFLTVALLSNVTVTAYNKTTQVGTSKSLNDLLDIDLLWLAGDIAFTVNLKPGGEFDRVKITLGNLVSLGANVLGGGVRIYDVARISSPPGISTAPINASVCAGQTATFSTTATGQNLSYSWEYLDSGTWTTTGTNSSSLTVNNTTTAMNGRKYRVKVNGGYCVSAATTVTSPEVTLTVKTLPHTPPVGFQQ